MAKAKVTEKQSELGREWNSKGKLLQKEYGEYLKKDLSWRGYKLEVMLSHNEGASKVDVIAVRDNELGKKYRWWFKVFSIACLLFGVLAWMMFVFHQDKWAFVLSLFPILLYWAGKVAMHYSEKYNAEHAWVECKNTKKQAEIDDIKILWSNYELYRESGNKEFDFKELHFVSVNGFIENAHRFAIERKIKCYVKNKNGIFVEAPYWD